MGSEKMGSVSRIVEFKPKWEVPTLVLVDLHEGGTGPDRLDHGALRAALGNCRAALDFARQREFPVAFMRYISPSRSFLSMNACPSWLRDFRPARSDMIFERHMPSCYASNEFAQMARCGGPLVLAGIFGETSCLATLMDGRARSHGFTYLSDASVSRDHDGTASMDMHRNVIAIAALYGEVSSTGNWINRMAHRTGVVG
jgi:nicotinamidase-related amidase